MRFDELNQFIPAQFTGDLHSNTVHIDKGQGWSVYVKGPGKYHAGDYVVMVDDKFVNWTGKKFKHSEFFEDIEIKLSHSPVFMREKFLPHLFDVTNGHTPPGLDAKSKNLPGIDLNAFLTATQALAVCEFRRYPQGDCRGGGRFLPINFMAAIIGGYWTATEASKLMRIGFPAIKKLDGFTPFKLGDNPHGYTL